VPNTISAASHRRHRVTSLGVCSGTSWVCLPRPTPPGGLNSRRPSKTPTIGDARKPPATGPTKSTNPRPPICQRLTKSQRHRGEMLLSTGQKNHARRWMAPCRSVFRRAFLCMDCVPHRRRQSELFLGRRGAPSQPPVDPEELVIAVTFQLASGRAYSRSIAALDEDGLAVDQLGQRSRNRQSLMYRSPHTNCRSAAAPSGGERRGVLSCAATSVRRGGYVLRSWWARS
jgi:hypothetical protein